MSQNIVAVVEGFFWQNFFAKRIATTLEYFKQISTIFN